MVEEKLKKGYTPAQIGAYVMLLCQSEQQPRRGRFRSLVELKAAMDCMVETAGASARMSQFVSHLLKQDDVERQDDGTYYPPGWDEWQEGNWQVAERMRRVREGKAERAAKKRGVTRTDTDAVTGTDTAPVTPEVTVPTVTPTVTPGVTATVSVEKVDLSAVTARDARSSAAAAAP